MDEFGMGSSTSFSYHGPSFNPYSPGVARAFRTGSDAVSKIQASRGAALEHPDDWLTPGGSSGGSAVAVSTSACAAALGSDTGGSIRQPAALCGVVGFKPSYGAISRWGLIAYASSLDTVGILSRNVDDAALMFDVVSGHDEKDDTSIRRSSLGVAAHADGVSYCRTRNMAARLSLAGLKIGIPREFFVQELNGSIEKWWKLSSEWLRDLGATVVPVALPSVQQSVSAYYIIAAAEAASNLSRYDGVRYGHRSSVDVNSLQQESADPAAALHALYTATRTEGFGSEVKRRIMMGNYVLSHAARAELYEAAVTVRQQLWRDFSMAFRPADPVSIDPSTVIAPRHPIPANPSGVDIMLLPTCPSLPWSSFKAETASPVDMYLQDIMTIPASLARLPAISIPVGFEEVKHADGKSYPFPVGMQLVGRFADETTVLEVASLLEAHAKFSPAAYLRASS
jgi:aspartyl-tRNA(Asn)/glutamyl-tRNA(Gln) amidotransferase subunit A